MTQEEPKALSRVRRPRGVLVLALLLFLFAGVGLLAALLPQLREPEVPTPVYLVASLYFGMLGWGLLKLRRWAWYATLIAIAISAYFGVQLQLASLLFLAAAAAYLLWPKVRVAFLGEHVTPGR
jgi:hypothetical protein